MKQLKEAYIDAQFAQMAHDKRYIQAQLRITQEFEHADWEALQLAEGSKPK